MFYKNSCVTTIVHKLIIAMYIQKLTLHYINRASVQRVHKHVHLKAPKKRRNILWSDSSGESIPFSDFELLAAFIELENRQPVENDTFYTHRSWKFALKTPLVRIYITMTRLSLTSTCCTQKAQYVTRTHGTTNVMKAKSPNSDAGKATIVRR